MTHSSLQCSQLNVENMGHHSKPIIGIAHLSFF